MGATRDHQPVLSYLQSGALTVAFVLTTPLTSFAEITVETEHRMWTEKGSIACEVHYIQDLQHHAVPVCSAEVMAVAPPHTMKVQLCSLRDCITNNTAVQVRCTTNLASNGPVGLTSFSLYTTADAAPLLNQPGYDVLPTSEPSAAIWIGASLSSSYVSGEDSGSFGFKFLPSQPLGPSGTMFLFPERKLWNYIGPISCFAIVQGIKYNITALANTTLPYMLQVQLKDSNLPAITSEVGVLCSGSNLARNGDPGPVRFGFYTDSDTVHLQNQSGFTIMHPLPVAPSLPKDYKIPIASAVLNQGSCGSW